MKKHIALFGGSFDPIHLGHLSILISIVEKYKFDEVFLIPAFCSPHKENNPPKASCYDRLEMAKLAIPKRYNWQVSALEIERNALSYTVDTLQQLRENFFPEDVLYFIIAEEHIASFAQWKQPEKVLSFAKPLVACSKQDSLLLAKLPLSWQNCFSQGMVRSRVMEISSTEIRERLAKDLGIEHLVPQKVLDYIITKKLYI